MVQRSDFQFLGFIPYTEDIIEADLDGLPPFEKDRKSLALVKEMLKDLEQ